MTSTLRSVLKEAKVQSVEELSQTVLAELNKGPMSKMIIDLAKLIKENVVSGRFAFGKTPRGPRCARQARQRLARKTCVSVKQQPPKLMN